MRKLIVFNQVTLDGYFAGKSLFDEVQKQLNLKLTDARTFQNGNVLLRFEPVS